MTTITLNSIDDTERLARALALIAEPGLVVLLDGPVGAGKTTLARATLQIMMRKSSGQIEDIPSPTFTLVQSYQIGTLEAWHADLYRLSSVDELIELGLEQAFEDAFCLIEWPDRMGEFAPDTAVTLSLSPDLSDPSARRATLSGPDQAVENWLNYFERQAA